MRYAHPAKAGLARPRVLASRDTASRKRYTKTAEPLTPRPARSEATAWSPKVVVCFPAS